ncbi:radical SAM protein [Candidatus Woesearchaeota archaeon]|nr:radical SAM protein [Candidatus Woesearchaeota archaeon]
MDHTTIGFEDLLFEEREEGVRVVFLRNYHFFLSKESLEAIAPYEVRDGSLVFEERERRVWNKFNLLLDEGLGRLVHRVRNKPCLYLHEGSGIPLLGSNEFGIIDRGSNILEVKPLTGCNLSCTFCSVGEGENDKRDILVEEGYLVSWFSRLAKLKEHPVEANIGPQGEPLLYPKLVELVRDLKAGGAAVVSMNTNGTLLHARLIDDLAAAGLDRINLSLHALDQGLVNKLMGGAQHLPRLREMIARCEGRIDVLLTPVLIPGVNDDQLDALLGLAKTIKNKRWPAVGVQNFLHYPGGRNPGVQERPWEEFYALLRRKEEEHGLSLVLKGGENVFGIYPEKTLPKPFRKGQVITVVLQAPGRSNDEWLGVSSERVVTVRSCGDGAEGERRRVRLLRDKHNIFTAVPV